LLNSISPFLVIPALSGFALAGSSRFSAAIKDEKEQCVRIMAGLGKKPVQVLSTGLPLHWEFLRLRTGFELPSSCRALPCYAADLNRNSFCVMRWPKIGLGAQDLNGFQRPKSFQKSSWK
jgi:hypothetical protein